MTLAPDVECEKLCWYSCYSWHSSARSATVDSIPGAAGELSPCPTPPRSLPTSDGPDSQPSLLGQAWRNALLHAEQARAGGHRARGFRGRLLRVMDNSWPLWTFQLRPLSLMGNPNRDLFIKTISWLFVVPASHKEATSRPVLSPPPPALDYITVSDYILHSSYKLTPITSLMMRHAIPNHPPLCPTFPLILYLQLPISLPFPPPLSWVHPHAVTLNLNI